VFREGLLVILVGIQPTRNDFERARSLRAQPRIIFVPNSTTAVRNAACFVRVELSSDFVSINGCLARRR
jgi:hypothetical protein